MIAEAAKATFKLNFIYFIFPFTLEIAACSRHD